MNELNKFYLSIKCPKINSMSFMNLSRVKISKVCNSYMSCNMHKSVADKQMHGILKFDKKIFQLSKWIL